MVVAGPALIGRVHVYTVYTVGPVTLGSFSTRRPLTLFLSISTITFFPTRMNHNPPPDLHHVSPTFVAPHRCCSACLDICDPCPIALLTSFTKYMPRPHTVQVPFVVPTQYCASIFQRSEGPCCHTQFPWSMRVLLIFNSLCIGGESSLAVVPQEFLFCLVLEYDIISIFDATRTTKICV